MKLIRWNLERIWFLMKSIWIEEAKRRDEALNLKGETMELMQRGSRLSDADHQTMTTNIPDDSAASPLPSHKRNPILEFNFNLHVITKH